MTTDLKPAHHPIGAIVANMVIVSCTPSDQRLTLSRYRVKALCCGRESEISHGSLRDRVRTGITQCALCARQQAAQAMVTKARGFVWTVGERFGPLEIIAHVRADIARVRWTCCGREEVMGRKSIIGQRHQATRRPGGVCNSCRLAIRKRDDIDQVAPRQAGGPLLPEWIMPLYALPVPAGLARDQWGHPCLSF